MIKGIDYLNLIQPTFKVFNYKDQNERWSYSKGSRPFMLTFKKWKDKSSSYTYLISQDIHQHKFGIDDSFFAERFYSGDTVWNNREVFAMLYGFIQKHPVEIPFTPNLKDQKDLITYLARK